MRRLNGDYDLEKIIIENNKFKILTDIPIDKSHFYSQYIIAKKIKGV